MPVGIIPNVAQCCLSISIQGCIIIQLLYSLQLRNCIEDLSTVDSDHGILDTAGQIKYISYPDCIGTRGPCDVYEIIH